MGTGSLVWPFCDAPPGPRSKAPDTTLNLANSMGALYTYTYMETRVHTSFSSLPSSPPISFPPPRPPLFPVCPPLFPRLPVNDESVTRSFGYAENAHYFQLILPRHFRQTSTTTTRHPAAIHICI